MNRLLLFSIFVVATCGLIYELAAGTLASYLLGDSITQFSTIIGVYLFSMGIGSYLSKFIEKNLTTHFVRIEILIGLIGGFSSSILFLSFEQVESFRFLLYFFVTLTGTLVGLEIPLLMRICFDETDFKDVIANVFTFDYIGALIASLLFPLVLVPHLGIIRTSILFGIFNILVALALCFDNSIEIKQRSMFKVTCLMVITLLLLGFVYSEKIVNLSEAKAYDGNIIIAKSSPYQRIIVTRDKKNIKLYLNGNLQFSSEDEYRYHEALVHPVMSASKKPSKVLILGGGDGFAIREVDKYASVDSIFLVDLDTMVTYLFKHTPMLAELNNQSLSNKKLTLVNADAFEWIKHCKTKFDVIIVDFPDPSNFSVGKLYTKTFYGKLYNIISDEGKICIQSTSPFVAPKSYWCVESTLKQVGFNTYPFHCYVPSFGDWGYIIATKNQFVPAKNYLSSLRFVNKEAFEQMSTFTKDEARVPVEINKLNNQILVHYFNEEWGVVN